jgi:hypothetical protein
MKGFARHLAPSPRAAHYLSMLAAFVLICMIVAPFAFTAYVFTSEMMEFFEALSGVFTAIAVVAIAVITWFLEMVREALMFVLDWLRFLGLAR